jgi:hypothetical protein
METECDRNDVARRPRSGRFREEAGFDSPRLLEIPTTWEPGQQGDRLRIVEVAKKTQKSLERFGALCHNQMSAMRKIERWGEDY